MEHAAVSRSVATCCELLGVVAFPVGVESLNEIGGFGDEWDRGSM